jgi:hypothetical protein
VDVCRSSCIHVSGTASTYAHSADNTCQPCCSSCECWSYHQHCCKKHWNYRQNVIIWVSQNAVHLCCVQSLCTHCMCILMQSMHTELAGIIMMTLLHIWGIPASDVSMDTSCLETSCLGGFQCQCSTSNNHDHSLYHPFQLVIY